MDRVIVALRRVAACARADWLERSRRPAFLVTLGVGLWASWVFSPPNGARWVTIEMSGHRGLYDSAWLGCATAVLTTVFFSLAGFYIVKNAVDLDRTTGVGAVLAATPMRKAEYLFGKWLANVALLAAMVGVIVLGTAGMQIVRGEDPHVQPLVLLAPFVFVTLPSLALVSAVAVAFEATPLLAGGFGNVAYYFLWMSSFVGSDRSSAHPTWDPLGVRTLVGQMLQAGAAVFPDVRAHPERFSVGLSFRDRGAGWHLTTFAWSGVKWTPDLVVPRLALLAVAAAIVAGATFAFDRFAHAGEARRVRGRAAPRAADVPGVAEVTPASTRPAPLLAPSRWPAAQRRFDLPALVGAELRLLFARTHWAWWLVGGLSLLPVAFGPRDVAGRFAAFTWLWPVLHWSALGARDRRFGTNALLDSSARPLVRQLPAAWLAGMAPGVAAGAVLAVRALAAGDPGVLAGALAGAAFVPALALALGTLTGGRKTFEIVYVILAYIGPLNGGAPLDFTGASGAGSAPFFATAALVALAVTALARIRRVALA